MTGTCNTCGRPANAGYVNEAAGERCVDSIHSPKATFLPRRRFSVAKQVNGGHWLSLGTFDDVEAATIALSGNRAFHAERCPSDIVNYSMLEV